MTPITFETFEKRAAAGAYDGWWSSRLVQERALAAEAAASLLALIVCNQCGVLHPTRPH